MRTLRQAVWVIALATALLADRPASAAWNNVFQVCCHNCRSSVSAYAPVVAAAPVAPVADACPQQQCTTRYVQRCYYQPVTTYRTSTYYEPVTTYRTSYYYEPCNSYRYSCYYDPCTCSYQQVAVPVTSYRLRSQCCPVTSYLQRTAMTPVTSYQQMSYYEPVTTCCQTNCSTTVGAPVAAPPAGAAIVNGQQPTTAAPPTAVEQRQVPPAVPAPQTPAPPSVQDSRDTPADGTRLYRNPTPPANGNGAYRQPAVPSQPTQQRAPAVRLDRIVAIPSGTVEGRVVSSNSAPQANARVLFVNAERQGNQQAITTNRGGQFHVALSSGAWLVYLHDGDGRPVFHRKIDVRENANPAVTLVSR